MISVDKVPHNHGQGPGLVPARDPRALRFSQVFLDHRWFYIFYTDLRVSYDEETFLRQCAGSVKRAQYDPLRSGHRDEKIPGRTRIPYDLRISLAFIGFPWFASVFRILLRPLYLTAETYAKKSHFSVQESGNFLCLDQNEGF